MALLDMAHRINPNLKVFTGDTEFLFPETYDLIERVESRYGITIERLYSDLTPHDQERTYGKALWASDPDQCCNLRKVEPLRRKLATLDAWVTAIRRDQTSARAAIRKIDWDQKFDLVKISPLADWTREKVWSYVLENDVPYNPSARPQLSQHRVHPLHARRAAGRRSARGAMVGFGEKSSAVCTRLDPKRLASWCSLPRQARQTTEIFDSNPGSSLRSRVVLCDLCG